MRFDSCMNSDLHQRRQHAESRARISTSITTMTSSVPTVRGTRWRCAHVTAGLPRYANMAPIRNGVRIGPSQCSNAAMASTVPAIHR